MPKPSVHLICNAHLDPVWQWEWEEGAAEAISTFRTAADLCDEFPEFIFCHNEAILYEWVEEYEPALFARIQQTASREGLTAVPVGAICRKHIDKGAVRKCVAVNATGTMGNKAPGRVG